MLDEPIVARYVWDADAMTEALAAHQRHSLRRIFRYLLILLVGFYVLVSAGLPLWLIVDSRSLPETRRNAFIALVAVGLIWAWLLSGIHNQRFLRWKARRVFRSMPNQSQFVEWSIGAEELTNRTTNSASTILWPLFIKVVETTGGFMLYQSIQYFNWIPGSAFASESELRRFADLARSRVTNFVILSECQYVGKPDTVGLNEL